MKNDNGTDQTPTCRQAQRLNRVVLVVLFTLLAVSFLAVIRFFVVPIILATTLATLFYPFYRWVRLKLCRNNRTVAALLSCLTLVTGLFVPLYLTGHLVALQSMDIYSSSQNWSTTLLENNVELLPDALRNHPLVKRLELDKVNWTDELRNLLRSSGKIGALIINRTSEGVFQLVAGAFLTLVTLFFFFRDGEWFVRRARDLSPLRPRYEEMIMSRFVLVARATIKGTVIIGLVQGFLGSAALLLLGFKAWLLWGVVMIILSIIPIVGSYFVLVPASLFLFWNGRVVAGILALVTATLLNYGVDYLLRPRLVGHDTKVHDLIILFSTLGGLAMFGVMGFVIGPVIAMLFVTMVDIYEKEFKAPLAEANSGR